VGADRDFVVRRGSDVVGRDGASVRVSVDVGRDGGGVVGVALVQGVGVGVAGCLYAEASASRAGVLRSVAGDCNVVGRRVAGIECGARVGSMVFGAHDGSRPVARDRG